MNHQALAAIVVCLTGCVSAGAASPSAAAPRLRFEIHIPDQVSSGQVGNPAQNAGRPVEMSLTNVSDRTLWINTLTRVGPSMSGMHEVQLTIRGPSGDLPFYCKDKGRFPNTGDYASLKPGESITRRADDLWCYYDLFTHPGTYTAQASYHDRNPQPPPPPPGAEPMSEELIAEPVQFQVVAK